MATYTYTAVPTSGATMTHTSANTTWCELEPGKLIIIYKQDVINKSFAVVVTLNGTGAPTYDTPYEINTWAYSHPFFKAIRVPITGEAANTYKVVLKMSEANTHTDISQNFPVHCQVLDVASNNSITTTTPTYLFDAEATHSCLETNQDGICWYVSQRWNGSAYGGPKILKLSVVGSVVSVDTDHSVTGNASWYTNFTKMRKLDDGRMYIVESDGNGATATRAWEIGLAGAINAVTTPTGSGLQFSDNTDTTLMMTTVGNNMYIQNTTSWARLAAVNTDTGNSIIRDAIGVDEHTWITVNFPHYQTVTGTAAMDIRVYRYIPDPAGSLPADNNPIAVPNALVGHYGSGPSGEGYPRPNPHRIFHRIDDNTIGLFGLYDDAGTTKMGFQFITAI